MYRNIDQLELDLEISGVEQGWYARGNASWIAKAFSKNVEGLLLNANEENEDDNDGLNDEVLDDVFTDESSSDEN